MEDSWPRGFRSMPLADAKRGVDGIPPRTSDHFLLALVLSQLLTGRN